MGCMALGGTRKYNRGKATRASTLWAQTMVEVEESEYGKRAAKRLKAMLVDDRSKDTLVANIKAHVTRRSEIQTDMWKGYNSLGQINRSHESVNHKKRICFILSHPSCTHQHHRILSFCSKAAS